MVEPAQQAGQTETQAPVTIKKYANRRLYNTATSSYVTLDHLCQMVKDGVNFAVYDAKSGEDITRAVLTQIIVEEEGKGQNLLPISFLRQLIAFYGDSTHEMLLPRYLDYSMKSFSRNQEKLTEYMNETFGGMFPFGPFEEMSKQNMAMFERAMNFFSPFGGAEGEGEAPKGEPGKAPPAGDSQANQIELLQKQLEHMQQQLKVMGEMAKKAQTGGKKS